MSEPQRVLIVCDVGGAWYVRRVRLIEWDLDRDEKVYRCDKPLGGPFLTLDEAVAHARTIRRPTRRRPSR
jgi:hypothetical protein